MGYEDDLNLYAYVRNDPLSATDPTGTDACPGVANCWRGEGDARAGSPTFVPSEQAVATVVSNRDQLSVRSIAEARNTNEKLSVVRDGSTSLERVSDASASVEGNTITTTGETVVSDVDLAAHGHPNDDGGTIAPGLGDDQSLAEHGIPNAIVQDGRVAILEMVDGRYQFRFVVGRPDRGGQGLGDVDERDTIQERLNLFQGRVPH